MFALVPFGQLQIFSRRLSGFLDESVQQDHSASLIDVEENTRNSVLTQAGPHFVDALA